MSPHRPQRRPSGQLRLAVDGGFLCFNPSSSCNSARLTLPVLDYPHLNAGLLSDGGLCVSRSLSCPSLRGTYFYGDFCAGFVKSFRHQNWSTHRADRMAFTQSAGQFCDELW